MKAKFRVPKIMFSLLIIMMPVLLSACSSKAAANAPQSLTGVLIDVHCFMSKPDITLDSKKCLLMPTCAATGYGIAVLKEDKKTYDFYFLDGDFAPAATGSQLKANELIKASSKMDHFYISVTGVVSAETKTIAYGKTYPIINVTSMVEVNEP